MRLHDTPAPAPAVAAHRYVCGICGWSKVLDPGHKAAVGPLFCHGAHRSRPHPRALMRYAGDAL